MKKAFDPVVSKKSKILLLGTMPGERSLLLQEYYGNKGNQFWRLLFTVFNKEPEPDYAQKIKFLDDHDIALWDMLQYCEREGSLDSKIKNEVANNFSDFYKKYSGIKKVFFTSKNAAAYYDKYVGRKPHLIYSVLPSPSGANATMTFSQKLEVWKSKILDTAK